MNAAKAEVKAAITDDTAKVASTAAEAEEPGLFAQVVDAVKKVGDCDYITTEWYLFVD